jgi:hypothetical protein
MKAKIMAILVMTLLIATALPAVGTMTNSNGSIDSGQEIVPNFSHLLKKTPRLRGYKIAVINAGSNPGGIETQLELWGATADLINIPDITWGLLSIYRAVWIPIKASKEIDNAFKDDEIRDYVFDGGGMIFCQPSPAVTPYIPKCLPYTWEILDTYYVDPCAVTIVHPTHELTNGLTIHDMPDCYETMGTIAPEYTVLVLSEGGEPGLACTTWGTGKIIIQMDATFGLGTDLCGDNPPLTEDMVVRMLDWTCKGKSTDLPVAETVNKPLLQFLQSYPNMFPLLQKLFQRLGLQ